VTQYYVKNVEHQVKVTASDFKFWSSATATGAKGLSGGHKMGVSQYVVAVENKREKYSVLHLCTEFSTSIVSDQRVELLYVWKIPGSLHGLEAGFTE
jgi:hypothetical protein